MGEGEGERRTVTGSRQWEGISSKDGVKARRARESKGKTREY